MVDWARLVHLEDWNKYLPILQTAKQRNVPFALTGGLAFSEYACRMRNTKDVDLLVTPDCKDAMTAVLTENGWTDYGEKEEYDRSWLYRGTKDDLICDIIWSLPNHRFDVDLGWLTGGPQIEIHGEWIRLVGLEHLILAKLFVFQRDRCDWPDLLNVLAHSCRRLKWNPLLEMVGRDVALLGGLLSVFRWLSPKTAETIPAFVWKEVGLLPEVCGEPLPNENRAFLLDTRNWFGPNVGG